MFAQTWNGVGDYDALITLSEQEMKELTNYYNVDWSFFTTGPSKSWDDTYYCFVSQTRKALALLPFLSLAFGAMYDEPPMEDDAHPIQIHFAGYTLEEFAFPR